MPSISLLSLFLVLLLIFGIRIPLSCAEVVDKIIAQVNKEIITMSELDQMIKHANPQGPGKGQVSEAVRRQMLDGLIDRRLAKEEAQYYKIKIPDKDVDKVLEQMKQKNNITSNEAMAQALAKDGMTLEQVRQQITEQLQQDHLMQFLLGKKVKITEEDIRRYYQNHYRQGANQVHIKVIELPLPSNPSASQMEEVRALAEKIIEECRRGGSFEALAKQYSQSPTGSSGGDLGYINKNDLDPRLYEFLDRLRPGEVVPIQNPNGFQIIKLVDRRAGQSKTLEEAKPEIQHILMNEAMAKEFSVWIKTLREKALIKIFL
jgi:peptidyl-prolyl cis-trans isomerase SurA